MSDDEREVEIDYSGGDSGGEDHDQDGVAGDGDADGDDLEGSAHLDKRAHHNALERKRRDHIKESFSGLRDAIPTMQGDKSSRAQILKKASEYITHMRKRNTHHQREIDDLKTQNGHLEAQIRALERAKSTGQFSSPEEVLEQQGLNFDVGPPPVAVADNSHQVAVGTGEEDVGPMVQLVAGGGGQMAHGGSIQPGQSLLIMTNGEPQKKRIKS